MGFFGSLFGWDQAMAAVNAVLASHYMEKASVAKRSEVAAEVARIMQSVRRNQTPEKLLIELSREDRVVQGNFVAIACDNLGFPPPVSNNVWTRVKNPYAASSAVTDEIINRTLAAIEKQDGVKIQWPGRQVRINFAEMI